MITQHRTRDEFDAGVIQERWLAEIAKRLAPEGPAEVKVNNDGHTHLTTVWSKHAPMAFAIRTRDDLGCTVLTLVEIAPALIGALYHGEVLTLEEARRAWAEHDGPVTTRAEVKFCTSPDGCHCVPVVGQDRDCEWWGR